jgi:L-ribulose-5-phosphate 3-epimerase UlaE
MHLVFAHLLCMSANFALSSLPHLQGMEKKTCNVLAVGVLFHFLVEMTFCLVSSCHMVHRWTFPLGSRSPQLTTTMVSLLDQGYHVHSPSIT